MTGDGWAILNATSKCFFESCDGHKLQLLVKEGEVVARECLCYKKAHVVNNFNHANLPLNYSDVTVDSFDIDLYHKLVDKQKAAKAKKYAVDYVQNYEKYEEGNFGLFLHSETKGTGKTRLAISILIALIKVKEIRGLYCSEYEILDSIKSTFNDSELSTRTVIKHYSRIPVLIIDDFGLEKQTDWAQQTFTKIIDERLNNNRLTIFTSNLTYDQIKKIYKEGRLPSRLQAMTIFIEMPEEDVRVKIATQKKEEIRKRVFE